MKWSQLKYLTAIVLIGDGILAMLRPHRDAYAWGPEAWKKLMQYLSDHPEMLRAIGTAEVALGFALIAPRGSTAEQLAKGPSSLHAQIASIV